MKKRIVSILMVLAMALSLLPSTAMAAELTQLATPTELQWACGAGVISGTDGGELMPKNVGIREQVAVILYNYAKSCGQDVSVGENTNILSYEDALDISQYAIPAMQWACGAGILSGMGDGTLAPKADVTRGQVAAMLRNFSMILSDQ